MLLNIWCGEDAPESDDWLWCKTQEEAERVLIEHINEDVIATISIGDNWYSLLNRINALTHFGVIVRPVALRLRVPDEDATKMIAAINRYWER